MSSAEWILEPNAERDYLLPWLLQESDPQTRDRVVAYIAGLVKQPFRPLLEEDNSGVFSLERVPGTRVGLLWTLDTEGKQVVLAHVGQIVP